MMSYEPSSQFKTLSFKDPQFASYLRGTFSKNQMAIPVSTLNVRSQIEEVTFEVVDRGNVQRPPSFVVILKLLRPQTLTFSVGTMFASFIVATRLKLDIDSRLALFTIFSVMFFHAAINLLNDYYDHMRGHDRVNPRGGSRVIQRGWVSAHLVQKFGFGFLVLAFILGIPIFTLHSSIAIFIALISALAGLEFSTHRLGFKNLGLGEYLVFLLTGPLLTCGFVWATSELFSKQILWLGAFFGFVTLFFYHASNIENILADAQASRKTWAVYVGIDRAKKILWGLAGCVTLSYFSFAASFDSANFLSFLLLYVVVGFNLLLICLKSTRARSPLSGELESIRKLSLRLHWLAVMCIVIATI